MMFSQEMEYFKLRDTLSEKLSKLYKKDLITLEIAENIYDDILFKLLEKKVRVSDDKRMNKIISYEISNYCSTHEYLGFCRKGIIVNTMIVLHMLNESTIDSFDDDIRVCSIGPKTEKERRVYHICLY